MPLTLNDPALWQTKGHINGAWTDATSGKTFAVLDPATGEHLAGVPDMGASETRYAIESANTALPAWRARTAKDRANILRKWFDLCMAAQADLALLMTREQGKPLAEAAGEVAYGASFIEWFAEEGKRIYGDVIPSHGADKRIITVKQPIGVVAAITPGTSRWR